MIWYIYVKSCNLLLVKFLKSFKREIQFYFIYVKINNYNLLIRIEHKENINAKNYFLI